MNPIVILNSATASIRIHDCFLDPRQYQLLRHHFESRFENPNLARSDRFVWDWWNVPGQFRLLRTPAESFFPKKIYRPFLNHLLNWSRQNLGCQMISHPWVSAYVDGCEQKLHTDVPHGPYSFVFSIGPKKRNFLGGDTLIAKPKLLRYFSELRHHESDESAQLFDEIAPNPNRLTVFDPRYPHGVSRVQGAGDLLEARTVIHGWFTEPRPMIEGGLSIRAALPALDRLAETYLDFFSGLSDPDAYYGLLSLRFEIAPTGMIQKIQVVAGHLVNSLGRAIDAKLLLQILDQQTPPDFRFPKSKTKTWITLPLELKR